MKAAKTTDQIKEKKMIVSVIGTTTSGKTFLIFNLTKLFTFFDLTKVRLPYTLKPLTRNNVQGGNKPKLRSLNELTGDLKKNIAEGGDLTTQGTFHSLNPDLYEYQYDSLLEKVKPGFRDWFKKPHRYNVYFKIRNIPGEMLNVYSLSRDRGQATTTLKDLFNNFVIVDEKAENLLATFRDSMVENESDFKSLAERFYEYCKIELNQGAATPPPELADEFLIKKNFYSFLFFTTSTDVIICHDISTDVNQPVQRNILDYLPSNDPSIAGKHLYYAFTKYDNCVDEPLTNYIEHKISLTDVEDYWSIAEQNLNNVYKKKSFIKPELLDEIERLMQKGTVPKVPIGSGDEIFYILRYTYFICTNYRNLGDRGFLSFNKTAEPRWTDDMYVGDSFPMGCIELLLSLLDRNGISKPDELELDFNSHNYNLLKEAYVKM